MSAKLKFAKPEKRSTAKRRKLRAESKVKQQVRAQCVERDGDCRLARWPSDDRLFSGLTNTCRGKSEWAHLGEKKRARTRGMAPDVRHATAGSLMLCTRHHRQYDAGEITIYPVTAAGANGPLHMHARFRRPACD